VDYLHSIYKDKKFSVIYNTLVADIPFIFCYFYILYKQGFS